MQGFNESSVVHVSILKLGLAISSPKYGQDNAVHFAPLRKRDSHSIRATIQSIGAPFSPVKILFL